jgi:hypothetical protein
MAVDKLAVDKLSNSPLKTDFDQLIYNCGGILGLWFGITPIKAVNLIEYIPKIYRISMNVCETAFQFLIAFWIRIKQI